MTFIKYENQQNPVCLLEQGVQEIHTCDFKNTSTSTDRLNYAIEIPCEKIRPLTQRTPITRLSPVAWQHISLVGKYEFMSSVELPNIADAMDQLISNLDKVAVIPTS